MTNDSCLSLESSVLSPVVLLLKSQQWCYIVCSDVSKTHRRDQDVAQMVLRMIDQLIPHLHALSERGNCSRETVANSRTTLVNTFGVYWTKREDLYNATTRCSIVHCITSFVLVCQCLCSVLCAFCWLSCSSLTHGGHIEHFTPSVPLSAPCLRFTWNCKTIETPYFVETWCWTQMTRRTNLRS